MQRDSVLVGTVFRQALVTLGLLIVGFALLPGTARALLCSGKVTGDVVNNGCYYNNVYNVCDSTTTTYSLDCQWLDSNQNTCGACYPAGDSGCDISSDGQLCSPIPNSNDCAYPGKYPQSSSTDPYTGPVTNFIGGYNLSNGCSVASGGGCGDGVCNNGETCSTCPQDCGTCGGGGGQCTPGTSYYECETNPTAGACGSVMNNHNGNDTWDYVSQDSCGNWTCADQNTPCESTISGHVYLDTNGNGVQDTGEPNATSATPTTISVTGGGLGSGTITAQTDANGNYVLQSSDGKDLLGGNYTVSVQTAPTGYSASTPAQSVRISFSAVNPTNVNFGIVQNKISGQVFEDYNHNAVQDGPDGPMSGITVDDGAGDSVTTDSTGSYEFSCNTGHCVSSKAYTLTVHNPPDSLVDSGNAVSVTPNPSVVANFAVAPLYHVTGTITDNATGAGLASVPVTFFDQTTGGKWTYTTDASGTYTTDANMPIYYHDTFNVAANADPTLKPCTQGYICDTAQGSPNPAQYANIYLTLRRG